MNIDCPHVVAIAIALVLAFSSNASAQSIEYGDPSELCGTTRLFVDAGMYLKGRNNIVSIVENADLPGLEIMPNIAEADVLIKLTRTGARNGAEWSILVFGSDGTPRLVAQLADVDEGDGLRHFWPSSKIARKFIELHREASTLVRCPATVQASRSSAGTGGVMDLVSEIRDVFEGMEVIDSHSTSASDEDLADTRSEILSTLEQLALDLPESPLSRLARLELLHHLQRNLDFFWFAVESLSELEEAEESAASKFGNQYLKMTRRIDEVTTRMVQHLSDDLEKCGGQ